MFSHMLNLSPSKSPKWCQASAGTLDDSLEHLPATANPTPTAMSCIPKDPDDRDSDDGAFQTHICRILLM